jgi:hypothetical protein
MQHMEFVDLCHYLDSAYPRGGGEGISFDRLVETAYSTVDFASRITGGNLSNRPSVIARRALISIAPPIDLTERYAHYANDRKGAMDSALSALEKSYLDSIDECIDERGDR